MKQINVYFDDDEHKKLEDKKKELKLNWHDLILKVLEMKIKKTKKRNE